MYKIHVPIIHIDVQLIEIYTGHLVLEKTKYS